MPYSALEMPWQSYPTVPYAKEMATSSCDVSRSARRMHRVRTQNGKRRGVIPTKFVPRAPPISPLAPAHGNGKAGVVSLGRHPMIGWIKFGVPSRGSRPLAKHGSCCSRRLLSARHDNTKLFFAMLSARPHHFLRTNSCLALLMQSQRQCSLRDLGPFCR